MNTVNRNVGNIDFAIRRRFAFIDKPSKVERLEKFKDYDTEQTRQKAIGFIAN